MSAEMDSEVVAAIDFGTSYSGYAYRYKDTKEKIYINANWSKDSFISKFPIVMLFDDKENFAVDYYSKFAECDQEHNVF